MKHEPQKIKTKQPNQQNQNKKLFFSFGFGCFVFIFLFFWVIDYRLSSHWFFSSWVVDGLTVYPFTFIHRQRCPVSTALPRDALSVGQIVVPFAGVFHPLNERGAVLGVVCAVDVHWIAHSAVPDAFAVPVEGPSVHTAVAVLQAARVGPKCLHLSRCHCLLFVVRCLSHCIQID